MRWILLLVAALAIAGTAGAGNQVSPGWNTGTRLLQTCNDQQSTLTNCVTDTPTATGGQPCAWGDQDDLSDSATGKLSAGVSTSDTLCVITDGCSDAACPHVVLFQVLGGGLDVALTSDGGGSWAGIPFKSGHRQGYELCIPDPLFNGGVGPWPEIAGTNGGVGYLTNYTLVVTATKTTQFSGEFEVASSHSTGNFGWVRQLTTVPCPTD